MTLLQYLTMGGLMIAWCVIGGLMFGVLHGNGRV